MEHENYGMNLVIEGGAARIRITDAGSPRLEAQRASSWPRHPMTLRSHARVSLSRSNSSMSDVSNHPSSPTMGTRPLSRESEATTVIANTDETRSPISEPASPSKSSEGPFLSLTSTPNRNESRVWEYHAPAEPDFAIFEDAEDEESPLSLAPLALSDIDEDKENIYATISDYESPDEQETEIERVDWARVQAGPHDVFGLPIDSPFGPALADLPVAHTRSDIEEPSPIPTATDTNVRPAMRVILRDDESDEDWDDTLSTTQIRELQELSDVFARGAQQRRRHNRHFPMRDENVQGQANIFLQVRRVTEFQRHQNRHRFLLEEEE